MHEIQIPDRPRAHLIAARLLIGVIVLICAEVFSGASLPQGLWHPWTLLVTYWLYFAHFFFFTTLAIRTGRTSLSALYLWGILFGLYESWITKVIWSGYNGDGQFVLGTIGPYGFSEISMVFLFHPVQSFMLPLAIACIRAPALRAHFPDLAIFTGTSTRSRAIQLYIVLSLGPIMGFNSGGALNLVANLSFAVLLLIVLSRISNPALNAPDAVRIVAFGRRGFIAVCVYLAALYAIAYPVIRPAALPSVSVQACTLIFYALAITGLWLQRRRYPNCDVAPVGDACERRRVLVSFAAMIMIALVVSSPSVRAAVSIPVALNLGLWSLMGFAMMVWALAVAVSGARVKRETWLAQLTPPTNLLK